MTKRFKESVMNYIKAKRKRVSKIIRAICGKRIVNGRYRISEGMKYS